MAASSTPLGTVPGPVTNGAKAPVPEPNMVGGPSLAGHTPLNIGAFGNRVRMAPAAKAGGTAADFEPKQLSVPRSGVNAQPGASNRGYLGGGNR